VSGLGDPRPPTGPTYLWEFFNSYLSELVSSPKSLTSTLRLFQELDSHSVFHLLPSISQPVLIISGALDGVTPAMQSVQIARRIQHSTHYCVCVCLTIFRLFSSRDWIDEKRQTSFAPFFTRTCVDVFAPRTLTTSSQTCMKNYQDPFSTHATLLESPEWALAEIACFLRKLGLCQ
jgi:pimeloyl-ACP methyl ester carboxylesterase